jgi:hypothetical protein
MADSGCIYGGTGSWKTSQVKWLSRYIYEVTGKSTLLLSCDGGGWKPCQPEIDAGIIRAYRCDSATVPMPILQLISKGYWPENKNGVVDFRTMNWNEVGGMAIEGWTSISQVIMRYLPASGISVGGEDRSKLGGWTQEVTVTDADGRRQPMSLSFRSNTRGDFGFVQNHLYGLVTNFNSLPFHYVLHDALESKTEDEDRSTIYGPAIAGKKATSQCGAWVGDLIHAQDYSTPRTVMVPDPQDPKKMSEQVVHDITVRYFYKKHPDPQTGIMFPAKPRVTPEKIKELEKRFPGGYFEPKEDGTDSFAEYLRVLDALSAGAGDNLRKWREAMDQKLGRSKTVVAK